MIAIDRVEPDFYTKLPANATHAEFIAHEVEGLGVDHAALGSWLLTHWKLAESLCRTVAWSHAPRKTRAKPMPCWLPAAWHWEVIAWRSYWRPESRWI